MAVTYPPGATQNIGCIQNLTAQTSFHLVHLICQFILYSSSPFWETCTFCTQECYYSSNPYKDAIHIKSLQSSPQYINLPIVRIGKGFCSWDAKLWKWMKINQILFAKGQNFTFKSLALSWWFVEDRHEVYSPWTESSWPLESQRWRPINGPLLSFLMTLLTGISISWKPCRQWLPGQLLASAVFYELFIRLMLRISHYFTFPAILTIKLCHCHFHLPGGSQPLPAVGNSALRYVKQIFTAVSAHLGHNLHPRQAWEKHLLN